MLIDASPLPVLRAVHVQLMPCDGGVVVRRGNVQVQVSGEGAESALLAVLASTQGQGATVDDICAAFAAPDREEVARLVELLVSRRLLLPADGDAATSDDETALDVFYWHFGITARRAAEQMAARKTAVIGVNAVSRRLEQALRESGVVGFEVVDHPLLRGASLFDGVGTLRPEAWPGPPPIAYDDWVERSEDVDCLVATSDFGEQQMMRDFNAFCLRFGVAFLPVVLHDFIGHVGPLVVPGETACYECLRGRQNAHLKDVEGARMAERHAFEGRHVSAFHPSMASMVGDLAAVELTRHVLGVLPGRRAGTLIEVNLFNYELVARKVLKLPRCPACSPLNRRAPISPDRFTYLVDHEEAPVEP